MQWGRVASTSSAHTSRVINYSVSVPKCISLSLVKIATEPAYSWGVSVNNASFTLHTEKATTVAWRWLGAGC